MDHWIADRTRGFDSSGIRRVFELASKIKNPVNLSIGQPDFDVPEPLRRRAAEAIQNGRNAYTVTQGIPSLRDAIETELVKPLGHDDRQVMITSGTSGALLLAILSLVNPGDEVIIFDPYFVMYVPHVKLTGGIPILIDTAPDFVLDIDKVAAAITPRTKAIIFNSPANPTGIVASESEIRAIAELADKHGIALISDEIYRLFMYDEPFVSPSQFYDKTIVVDSFSKSHAMTGWRVGFAHGPASVIQTMNKLQQYSFVCAPQPFQWAAAEAVTYPMTESIALYRKKRDRIVAGLKDHFQFRTPGGAFYLYAEAPGGSGQAFVERAIERELLIIPGQVFSQHDTHIRISFAASDETIDRGMEILNELAHDISRQT